MSECQRCKSPRVLFTSAKCSDCCSVRMPNGKNVDGYVPGDVGIGGGDYVRFSWCLACGQIQGKWPLAKSESEAESEVTW